MVVSQGYGSKTYDPYPWVLNRHSAKRVRRASTKASKKNKRPAKQQRFKHGLEVPRTWNDIVRIDAEAGNRLWQEAAEKKSMF